jgi:hypothetical protein
VAACFVEGQLVNCNNGDSQVKSIIQGIYNRDAVCNKGLGKIVSLVKN